MSKLTFKNLFIIAVIVLTALPFITTFNEFLTSVVMKIGFYRYIQELIVPWEIQLVRVVIGFFGIESTGGKVFFNIIKNGKPESIWISWNCIGWQTFVLFAISLLTGIRGSYKVGSKIECVTIGVLGTFLMNIVRISIVVLLFYFLGRVPAIVFHDYLSTVMAIVWLLFFWWFSFKYVLEEKAVSD